MKIFMTIVVYVLYFFFYSAVGWLGESIYCSVGARKWVNRGFLKGPMCPIYGTGALAMAITLTPVKNLDLRVPLFGHSVLITPLLVFIAGMVVCDIVEFITSVLMEKLFHARWWDYSNKKFNIQGRICLGHTFYWGIASLLFLYLVHPIVVKLFSQLPDSAEIAVFACVLAVFLVDLVFAVYRALDVRKVMDKIKGFSDTLSNFAETVKNGVSDKVPSLDETKAKLENFKRDATAQLKEAFHSLPISGDKTGDEKSKKTESGKKKKHTLNRHFINSPNLLPYAQKQIKRLEEMYDEIRRAFYDDDDDDLY